MPNWGYQLHLASGEVENRIKSKDEIKKFLNSVYGGKGPNGEAGFSPTKGPLYENLPKLNQTPLMGEDLLEFYGAEYERHGMRGTRKLPPTNCAAFRLAEGRGNGSVLVQEQRTKFPR